MAFRPNPHFVAQMEASPRFKAGMAERTRAAANAISEASPTPRFSPRARGNSIVTSSHIWHIIEFGSKNNPAYAPIRRALRALGLRLNVLPKP